MSTEPIARRRRELKINQRTPELLADTLRSMPLSPYHSSIVFELDLPARAGEERYLDICERDGVIPYLVSIMEYDNNTGIFLPKHVKLDKFQAEIANSRDTIAKLLLDGGQTERVVVRIGEYQDIKNIEGKAEAFSYLQHSLMGRLMDVGYSVAGGEIDVHYWNEGGKGWEDPRIWLSEKFGNERIGVKLRIGDKTTDTEKMHLVDWISHLAGRHNLAFEHLVFDGENWVPDS